MEEVDTTDVNSTMMYGTRGSDAGLVCPPLPLSGLTGRHAWPPLPWPPLWPQPPWSTGFWIAMSFVRDEFEGIAATQDANTSSNNVHETPDRPALLTKFTCP
jgi:hypothetical protein